MQSTDTIFLIKPAKFGYNSQTAKSNTFQNSIDTDKTLIQEKAIEEFNIFSTYLQNLGVKIFIFEDDNKHIKPDAIFPNNWITTHESGIVILYPMNAPNRQYERRNDIIEKLKKDFYLSKIIDISNYEKENRFLEGTGSIVFDHSNKIAYACLSPRTNKELFDEVCKTLNYRPLSFNALDESGNEIYHTNVMMNIGENFSIICLDSIRNETERKNVIQSLIETGHDIIEISFNQMNNFAGNMLELKTTEGRRVLILSQRAFDSLHNDQLNQLKCHSELHPLSIPTIESIGGGSVRCMIAEIFLSNRS